MQVLLLLVLAAPAEEPSLPADISASTDDQYEVVRPTEFPEDAPDADGRRPLEVRGEFGRGIRSGTRSDSFAVLLRARAQLQANHTVDPVAGQGDSTQFLIRRMRLLLGGHALGRRMTFYIQLGFSDRDLERDRPVPLRDAFITWHICSGFNLRLGQMKVPFDRQRVTSSSRLQLVERSNVVNALNLDRDVGVQAYGALIPDRLTYFWGVFGGNGRNRTNPDSGLLHMGRLQWTPFGAVDKAESDLTRARRLRFALGLAAGLNHRAQRERSTQGAFFTDGSVDYLHVTADASLMYGGWSLTAQFLSREVRRARGGAAVRAQLQTGEAESVHGAFLQTGFMLSDHWEVALRGGYLDSFGDFSGDFEEQVELTAGLNWFRIGNDLKVQLAYTTEIRGDVFEHIPRIQAQAFF